MDKTLAHDSLTTPRAAALAGLVFSVLYLTSLVLIRGSVPADPQDAGAWLASGLKSVSLALYLLPFAGIAFLWFIGVLRDRMGELEDRFFATVFLGSGLLFLAMLFVAGAVAAGLIAQYGATPTQLPGIYAFGRAIVYQTINVYALKVTAVFMVSTSTVAIHIKIFPRWMAWLGYGLALLMLLSTGYIFFWMPLVFPLWVLLISGHILVTNLMPKPS
jgi:hypothetical protein